MRGVAKGVRVIAVFKPAENLNELPAHVEEHEALSKITLAYSRLKASLEDWQDAITRTHNMRKHFLRTANAEP